MTHTAHPVLSCDEALQFEQARFKNDEAQEWGAMEQAGLGVATALLKDFAEIGGFPTDGCVLVLAGKGHNAGDALIAARAVAEQFPRARLDVGFVAGVRALKPLAARAWRDLQQSGGERVSAVSIDRVAAHYDLILDGIFGFQFRPPLSGPALAWLDRVRNLSVRLRAAVDLPSGGEEPGAFCADFTYATGLIKAPLLSLPNAGRLRHVDLNFGEASAFPHATDWVLSANELAPLRALRPATSDKRSQGHLFVVGGSRSYPGAVLMSGLAALRSGVGLVTAFVPESLAAAFAARAPEAMWVGWPETPYGGLAMEGSHLFHTRKERATALLIGPGLGREPETLALVEDMVGSWDRPLVLDADALQSDIVKAARCPRVFTPHGGEYRRLAGERGLREYAAETQSTVVLKGPVTRLSNGGAVHHSIFGGPVLARGGSGDVLAGLVAGLLAQTPADPWGAACRGVVWHGRSADALAQSRGQVAVQVTDLLDFLPVALRNP